RESKEIQPSYSGVFEAKRRGTKTIQTDQPEQRRGPLPRRSIMGEPLRRELPQHVGQDPAVAEIFELVQRVDPAGERHAPPHAVGAYDLGMQGLTRLEALAQAMDGDGLVAPEAKRLPARSF